MKIIHTFIENIKTIKKQRIMKKIIIALLLTLGLVLNAQTVINGNLDIYENTDLDGSCIGGSQDFTVIGDVIFHGDYEIILKNTNFKVMGNVDTTTSAYIINFCNNGQSSVCVNGISDPQVSYVDITPTQCTLSTPIFETIPLDSKYKVYTTNGVLVDSGLSNTNMFMDLPKNQILLFVVNGDLYKKVIYEL